ncbi:phosphatidylserine decarboxylase 1 [Rhodotorula paludigena]|uniref:phosphatidylserine decarboxylase 1 n=1 Tax=Rhodotorula paludigena TaxID=86838 RepID=UPI00317ACDA6
MAGAARMPRWSLPALRPRRGVPVRALHASAAPPASTSSPAPPRLRKRDLLLRGPQLLLRGPGLLLRAPKAVWRAPGAARAGTRRLLSTTMRRSREQPPSDRGIEQPRAGPSKQPYEPGHTAEQASGSGRESFASRLRKRWNSTPTKWSPIPVSLGAAVLVVLTFYKQASEKGKEPLPDGAVKVQGPWQVHVIGALPLRSISRLYGLVNSYELPVWFRVPGYKFYSWVFGVNLDECEPSDLTEYRSMSEFFMRRLKPGVRPVADAPLVSPADGRVINFGVIEGGRIASVKGATYSLQALLQGAGDAKIEEGPHGLAPHPHNAEAVSIDEKEFANVNGINYSLGDLIGATGDRTGTNSPRAQTSAPGGPKDASISDREAQQQRDGPKRSLSGDVAVATEIAKAAFEPREGNKLCFSVIYLAPGDYHRFHSPTNWVVERRRHFAGELFSVSPWMVGKLADLFVLNERVALLGRWRYGFFSMVPVGATNVGSIRVNFDSSLRTNSPLRPVTPGTFSEATYANASQMLGGQPLRAGDEIGGFWLGSTIVLVFEAPNSWHWDIQNGQKLQVGQQLGHLE